MAVEHLDFGAGFRVGGPGWGEGTARWLHAGRWRTLLSGVHMLHMNQDVGFRVMLNDGTGSVAAVGNTALGNSLLMASAERWGIDSIVRSLGPQPGVLPLVVPALEAANTRLVGLLRYGAAE